VGRPRHGLQVRSPGASAALRTGHQISIHREQQVRKRLRIERLRNSAARVLKERLPTSRRSDELERSAFPTDRRMSSCTIEQEQTGSRRVFTDRAAETQPTTPQEGRAHHHETRDHPHRGTSSVARIRRPSSGSSSNPKSRSSDPHVRRRQRVQGPGIGLDQLSICVQHRQRMGINQSLRSQFSRHLTGLFASDAQALSRPLH
jgi:hypothetical protein